VAEPSGKQNTFAAHNPPEFVAVSVRHNTTPRNLANAFETAIRVRKDESLTKESATKLAKKAETLAKAFGENGETFVLNLVKADLNGFGREVDSLESLLTETMKAVKNWKG
jgi:CRISPR system Cascade subunit CasC